MTNKEIAEEFMAAMTDEAANAELIAAGNDPLAAQLSLESES